MNAFIWVVGVTNLVGFIANLLLLAMGDERPGRRVLGAVTSIAMTVWALVLLVTK